MINALHHSVSAARLYAALTKPGAAPFSIAMSWPTVFKTRRAYDEALKGYPDILTRPAGEPITNERIELDITRQHPYPSACANQVERYFRTAFDKALLELILDQKQNEVIVFKLQALPPKLGDGKWYVSFKVISSPMLTTIDDASIKQFAEIFPAQAKPQDTPK